MAEVVFSESAGGSLKVAAGTGSYAGGAHSVFFAGEDGETRQPDREELQRMLREFEEKEQINWGEAVPLGIELGDVLCFPLALSIGGISEDGIGAERAAALQALAGIWPEEARRASQDMLKTAQKSLDVLLSRAGDGERIRIWTSDTPDDACGSCWLTEQLKPIGFEKLDITYVKLPDFHVMPDGTAVLYSGWGEAAPHQWGRLASYGQKLHVNYMHALSFRWRQLKKENTPLRAVVNRQLVSVPETFYDYFIMRELDACEDEFSEAKLIGALIGKYSLGIGDSLIALRIERFIENGMLETVTRADGEGPIYHRILRKCHR